MSRPKLPRQDESPDELFYLQPRFVTHIDDGAIAAVTQLYREYFPAGGVILDLMSSWVSHFPPGVRYARAVGVGMNRAELGRNPRLTEFVVQNLNADPVLPFAQAEFDAGACCVSVDYLTDPVSVLREVGRILKPDGPFVVTFSNRCFPTKAVREWLETSDAEHLELVESWMRAAGTWTAIKKLDRSPRWGDPLYAVVGRAT